MTEACAGKQPIKARMNSVDPAKSGFHVALMPRRKFFADVIWSGCLPHVPWQKTIRLSKNGRTQRVRTNAGRDRFSGFDHQFFKQPDST